MSDQETKEVPAQIIIRDQELIAQVEAERVEKGDTSCARTAAKILLKYFAGKKALATSAAA